MSGSLWAVVQYGRPKVVTEVVGYSVGLTLLFVGYLATVGLKDKDKIRITSF